MPVKIKKFFEKLPPFFQTVFASLIMFFIYAGRKTKAFCKLARKGIKIGAKATWGFIKKITAPLRKFLRKYLGPAWDFLWPYIEPVWLPVKKYAGIAWRFTKKYAKIAWRYVRVYTRIAWKFTKKVLKKAFRGFMSAKTFWSAFAIVTVLFIISTVLLVTRLINFTFIDDRAVSLRSSMDESLDVFAMEYENDTGDITIKGHDGEKVIAPGSDVEYTLRLRNTDRVALNYSFEPDLEYTSEYKLPIVVRLLDDNDNYVIGSPTKWVPLDKISGKKLEGTLMQNETAEYKFQWKWPFESGDDAYDTFLGSATFDTNVGVELLFSIHSEVNTELTSNGGGLANSPLGPVLTMLLIALILAAVITLLMIYFIKMKAQKAALAAAGEGEAVEGEAGEAEAAETESAEAEAAETESAETESAETESAEAESAEAESAETEAAEAESAEAAEEAAEEPAEV